MHLLVTLGGHLLLIYAVYSKLIRSEVGLSPDLLNRSLRATRRKLLVVHLLRLLNRLVQ